MIFNLSNNAYIKLLSLKTEGQRLRIEIIGGGCSGLQYKMSWEIPTHRSDDKIITINDIDIVVDNRSALFLKNATLNYTDGLDGKGFEWNNPSAKRNCGCGTSFSV